MSNKGAYDYLNYEYVGNTMGTCPLVKVPPGYVVPEVFADGIADVQNLEVRPDDVWLLGLPKSGTTWATEMIWGVYHEADLTEAKSKYALERWTYAELNLGLKISSHDMDAKEKEEYYKNINEYYTYDAIKKLKNDKSPRFIKSHFPLCWLPPNLLDTCKVVYITRNFKDTWISMFKMIEDSEFQHTPTLEKLAELFLQDKDLYSPLPKHVKEAWAKRSHKNMYFLFYEDMKKDLPGVLRKMADFLNKNLSDEQVEVLVDHLSIESMRKNKFANMADLKDLGWLGKSQQFIRKGISGEWKNSYSPEFLEKYKSWWETHLAGSDFKFPDD